MDTRSPSLLFDSCSIQILFTLKLAKNRVVL
jgi:hypothetical protein